MAAALLVGLLPTQSVAVPPGGDRAEDTAGVSLIALPKDTSSAQDETVDSSTWSGEGYKEPTDYEPTAVAAPAGGAAPAPLTADAVSSGALVQAGDLPVLIAAPAGTGTPDPTGTWQVDLATPAETASAGVDGALIAVTPPTQDATKVDVALDYSQFKELHPADWASRLQLVQLPACFLDTPDADGCSDGIELPTTQDADTGLIRATVDTAATATSTTTTAALTEPTGAPRHGTIVTRASYTNRTTGVHATAFATAAASGGATVVAATDSGAGANGSFRATPLSASGTWSAGGSSGAFTWSYGIQTPPTPAGPTPQIALSYNSQVVDGRTSVTNNQASWVGDGWDYHPGFVERTYRGCEDDRGGTPNNTDHKTSDLCWGSWNAVLHLAGSTTELVRDDDTGAWRPVADDGSKVELKTGAANGDNDGEHWVVTDRSGTKYYFGLNHLPGWDSTKDATDSVFTVPVFGNHSGEPCHAAAFADSACTQAWRWNLDYVEDVHGNALAAYYGQETNYYAKNQKYATPVAYTRGGYLKRIEYGLRQQSDTVYGAPATARVNFSVAERCFVEGDKSCNNDDFTSTDPGRSRVWYDTPSTLYCASGKRCGVSSPTFWSRKRLSSITTQAQRASGSTAYSNVDTYNLAQSFPKTLVDGSPPLWLESITRTGYAPDGTTTRLPPVSFMNNNEPLPNRVITGSSDQRPSFDRLRIRTIVTETGGDISIEYSAPCPQGTTHPSPSANGTRCYPVYWSPDDNAELEWFNKYVVTAVIQKDRVGGAPDLVTSYEYVGDAAWANDQSEFSKPTRRTWNQWRGYTEVITRQGQTDSSVPAQATVRTESASRYFRGMDGDPLPGGAQRNEGVNDSEGTFIADDSPALQGQVAESRTYSGDGGSIVTRTVNHPVVQTLATRVIGVDDTNSDRPADDLGDLHAYRTHVDRTETTAASSGTFTGSGGYPADSRTKRPTRTLTTYDPTYGLPIQVETQGDTGRTGDESCTVTSYVHNTTAHLIGLPKEVRTTASLCADAAGAGPDKVMSDAQTAYDDGAVGDAPTKGLPTTVQSVDGNGTGWITTARTGYDTLGRVRYVKDAKDNTTSTAYAPTTGQVFSTTTTTTATVGTVTTTLGTGTVTVDPGRGLPLTSTDLNGKVTRSEYDGLGRLTSGWSPSRSSGVQSANVTYDYQVATSKPVTVTSGTLRDNGTYAKAVTVYDGLLRPRQTQSEAVGGPGRIITDTLYNANGTVRRANSSYLGEGEPDAELYTPASDFSVPNATETAYDGRGRAVKTTTLHDGTAAWSTSTTYGEDYSTVVPPTGGAATRSWTDALGRTTRTDYFTNAARTTFSSISYGYDARGYRTSVTDEKNDTWSYSFDVRGRRTAAIDPDAGSSTTEYDVLDRPYRTSTPLGALYTVYDALGRTAEVHDDSAAGTLRIKRTYDTLPGAKGQPVASTRYVDGQEYTTQVTGYDAEYRPTGRKVTIPDTQTGLGGTYTWAYTYTPTGNRQTTTLPAAGALAAEKVVTRYDEDDLPVTTSGSTWYTAGTVYSPFGEALRTVSGPAPYRVWTTNVIDPQTGRLERTVADRETTTHRLYDRTYTYDSAGNPTSVTDKDSVGAVDRQCYSYDSRDQLTHAWTSTDAGCAKSSTTPGAGPTTASVTAGSGDGYWQEFQYDAIGNRTKLIEHSTDRTSTGALDTSKDITRTGIYGNADLDATPGEPSDGGPHTLSALDSQVGTNGTATRNTYTYDDAGDTTKRQSGGDTQGLTWTREGKLASATGYLADGQGPVTGLGGKCVDLTSSNTADGTAVQIYSCNGTAAQQFRTHGQTLTVLGKCAQAMGTTDGVAIQLQTCDGGTDQTWQHRTDGSLYNPASGKCLAIPASNTTDGTDLIIYTCNGAGSQNWNIGDTTTYLYDADGNRLISTTATGRTLYLGDTELSVNADSTPAYGSRYYSQPGAPTVVRTARGGNAQKLGVLLTDPLGTATTSVDVTAGQTVSTRKFLPYGEPRGTTPTAWPDRRGYLGGSMDQATSLTHLGAREYDPTTGRFISADPLVDFTDPLSMNGYAYADNNPTAHSDPTGLFVPNDGPSNTRCLGPVAAADCAPPAPNCEPWCAPGNSGSSGSSGIINLGSGKVGGDSGGGLGGFIGNVAKGFGSKVAQAVGGVWDLGSKGYSCITGSWSGCTSVLSASWQMNPMNPMFGGNIVLGLIGDGKEIVDDYANGRPGEATGKLLFLELSLSGGGEAAGVKAAGTAAREGSLLSKFKQVLGACATTPNSFAPGTLVLLADGTTEPIEDVKTGDKVLATDPQTDQTTAETVTATIYGHGTKHLVQLTVATEANKAPTSTSTITATEGHPFWVPTLNHWIDAGDLHPGQWLQTSAGTRLQITTVKTWTQTATVHNLTVTDLHTYYVLAGTTPILVHNSCGPDDLVHVYRAAQKGNGPDELANGLNPARHAGGNGYAYVGSEDVAQKYADYSVGTHEDYYTKFTFRRSEFEEHFGTGLLHEGGPGLEWEIPHAKIDLFNRLTLNKEKLWAPW